MRSWQIVDVFNGMVDFPDTLCAILTGIEISPYCSKKIVQKSGIAE
jgi:hypothetical protein